MISCEIKRVFDLLKQKFGRKDKSRWDDFILCSQVSNHDELLAKWAKSETIIHRFDQTVKGHGKPA